MEFKHKITEIVKDTEATLTHICDGMVYYTIPVNESLYQLGIDINEDEWTNTDLYPTFKSITLMRWIRKGMTNGKLIQIK